MADITISESETVESWNIGSRHSTSVVDERRTKDVLEQEIESAEYQQLARETSDAVKRAMNLVGYEASKGGEEEEGETGKKNVGEVQEQADEKKDEQGDKTKEGKPAEVGEKREREGDGETGAGVSVEQAVAEKETGKEAKKAKTGEGKETHQKGKKGRGRPAKAKAKPKTPATSEGKKRPVGRPRKGSTVAAKDVVVTMEDAGDPAHHTRSKDVEI